VCLSANPPFEYSLRRDVVVAQIGHEPLSRSFDLFAVFRLLQGEEHKGNAQHIMANFDGVVTAFQVFGSPLLAQFVALLE